jgi:hypothetical protein
MSTSPIVPPIHIAICVAISDDIPNRVAYCYRCCDDPRTDSWLTVYNPHAVDVEAAKTYHQNKVQQIHDRKLRAVSQVTALMSAAVQTLDSAAKAHAVQIIGVDLVDARMLADDIIWVHYKCCGIHEHVERIHRLWHGADPARPFPKSDADLLNEIGQHRSNAALAHANQNAASVLKANAKL